MKISYNLLKEIISVDLPMEEQLDSLTSIGLEVEGNVIYESVLGSLEGVVVGKGEREGNGKLNHGNFLR